MAEAPFRGGILADAMGLGKTLTAITACQSLKIRGTISGSFVLFITVKSRLQQVREELLFNFKPVIGLLGPPAMKILMSYRTVAPKSLF